LFKLKTVPLKPDKNHGGGRSFQVSYHYLILNTKYPDRCRPLFSEENEAGMLVIVYFYNRYCAAKVIWILVGPSGLNVRKLDKILSTKAMAVELGILPSVNTEASCYSC
jgi:hypothetical protein